MLSARHRLLNIWRNGFKAPNGAAGFAAVEHLLTGPDLGIVPHENGTENQECA